MSAAKATRCPSVYREIATGKEIRCTREAGHDPNDPMMHRNFTPGHKIKWPDEAAIPQEAVAVTNHPVSEVAPSLPEGLCGISPDEGDASSCVFLETHEGSHSWE